MKYTIFAVLLLLFSLPLFSQESQYKLAQSFEQSGDYENAARIYEQLMTQSPRNEEFFAGFVRTNKALNRFSYILKYLENRLKDNQTPELMALHGELLWRTGKPNEANEAWEGLIDKYEDNPKIYTMLSDIQISLQVYDKAINTLKQGRKNLNDARIFSDNLSKLYIAVGDYESGTDEVLQNLMNGHDLALAQGRLYALMINEEAYDYIDNQLNSFAQSHSENYIVQMLYSWFLRTAGKLEQALKITKKIDEMTNANGRELMRFADESRRDGHYDIALRAYEAIIDRGNDNNKYLTSALYGYARTLEFKLQQQDKISDEEIESIIDRYNMIIEEHPNTPTAQDCRIRLADIYINLLEDYDKAEEELAEITSGRGNREIIGRAYYRLGQVQLIINDLDKAEYYFNTVINNFSRYTPEESDKARYKLAEIQYFKGNVDTARTMFAAISIISKSETANDALEKLSVIDQNKELVRALGLFAKAEMKETQRNEEEALSLYNEVIEISGGSDLMERAMIRVAELEQDRKNFTKSIEICEKLLNTNDKTIYGDKALMICGDSAMESGDTARAESYYLRILSEYPRSIFLSKAREKIRSLRQQEL